MIKNNFKVLLAKKEVHENRRITYRVISEETGLSTTTLTSYAKQNVKHYAASTLEAMCTFFGCDVGDLIYLEMNGSGGG